MLEIKEAYKKAILVLEKCRTKRGFRAAYPGYNGIWARDSIITSLGASLIEDKFKDTFKQSLITLASNQSENGQIPNAVLLDKNEVDYKSIDSSLWFIISHFIFKERFKDNSLLNKYKSNIKRALIWLSYQDMGEDGMLEQLPTTDWQDAFPHRYGHTINTQALYYKTLILTGQKKKADFLKKQTNDNPDVNLWKGEYYLPWRWKNHNKYQEKGEWFDTLGNLLATIFNLADKNKSEKILSYIKNEKINMPYPIKAIYPPIAESSKNWQDYFEDCDARTPHHYLNAGIWTYIGGFYILALIKNNKIKEAEHQLEKLAEANLKNNFSEWLNGKTGIPSKDQNQAWNAGTYILAYHSLKNKRCLI